MIYNEVRISKGDIITFEMKSLMPEDVDMLRADVFNQLSTSEDKLSYNSHVISVYANGELVGMIDVLARAGRVMPAFSPRFDADARIQTGAKRHWMRNVDSDLYYKVVAMIKEYFGANQE